MADPRWQQDEASYSGRFQLRERLGSGGMAEVFLAEMKGQDGFRKLVALKRIHAHLMGDEDFVSSFISEARLGGSLNHPNIVQTLDLGRDGDNYYLAMEYVQGLTLSQLLRHRQRTQAPLPLPIVLDIGRQLCDALAYAHTATDPSGLPLRMIHRDLKPENILLSHFGVAKITDFGVAKAASNVRHTASLMVKGTVAYMSPEQAASQELDHRSDLYALGAILFELLTLEPLYPEAHGLPGLFLVQQGNIEHRLAKLEALPPELLAVIERLLASDRENRPASAAEVKRELMALSARVPPAAMDLGEIVREADEARAAQRSAKSLRTSDLASDENPISLSLNQKSRDSSPGAASGPHSSRQALAGSSGFFPGSGSGSSQAGEPVQDISRPTAEILTSAVGDEGRAGTASQSRAAEAEESGSSRTGAERVTTAPDRSRKGLYLVAGALTVVAVVGVYLGTRSPGSGALEGSGERVVAGETRPVVDSASAGPGAARPVSGGSPGSPVPVQKPAGEASSPSGSTGSASQPSRTEPVVQPQPQPPSQSQSQSQTQPQSQPQAQSQAQSRTQAPAATAIGPTKQAPAAPPSRTPANQTRQAPAAPSSRAPAPAAREAAQGGTGFLTVNAVPYAYVFVDGQKQAETTPLTYLEVPAGRHKLMFKTEDGRTRAMPIDVKPGQHLKLETVRFE